MLHTLFSLSYSMLLQLLFQSLNSWAHTSIPPEQIDLKSIELRKYQCLYMITENFPLSFAGQCNVCCHSPERRRIKHMFASPWLSCAVVVLTGDNGAWRTPFSIVLSFKQRVTKPGKYTYCWNVYDWLDHLFKVEAFTGRFLWLLYHFFFMSLACSIVSF